jgi:hypothetical protein
VIPHHRVRNDGRDSIFIHTPGHITHELRRGEVFEGLVLSIYHGKSNANYSVETVGEPKPGGET